MSLQTNLLDVQETLSPRLKWADRVKSELRIATHYCDGQGWMAFSMVKACELLEGYDLTFTQQHNPFELMAGYCRLMDEAGILADNEPTEFDAIVAVAMIHKIRLWNEI